MVPEMSPQAPPPILARVDFKEIHGTIYFRDPVTGEFPERVHTSIIESSTDPGVTREPSASAKELDKKQHATSTAKEQALKEMGGKARPVRKSQHEARIEARELALKQKAENARLTRGAKLGGLFGEA